MGFVIPALSAAGREDMLAWVTAFAAKDVAIDVGVRWLAHSLPYVYGETKGARVWERSYATEAEAATTG